MRAAPRRQRERAAGSEMGSPRRAGPPPAWSRGTVGGKEPRRGAVRSTEPAAPAGEAGRAGPSVRTAPTCPAPTCPVSAAAPSPSCCRGAPASPSVRSVLAARVSLRVT